MTTENLSNAPTPAEAVSDPAPEAAESFADLLSAYEQSHAKPKGDGQRQLEGVIISLNDERVFLDIGYKIEGALARSAFGKKAEELKVGDAFPVSIKGRSDEGYYELSLARIAMPRDWSALEAAYNEKTPVVGLVTGLVKGGLTVDLGVRAFLPASRSGTRDAAEMEKLVGTEISCRITKLDTADENVVVDRRSVVEEQARAMLEERLGSLEEGATVKGVVRSLAPYGAFVEIEPGVDGLLHVSDIAHTRIQKPEDVLAVGQELQVRILKIDAESKKISLGLKQLQPEPWDGLADRYKDGDRVQGTVTRLADFGAFVEIEPGVEGLIHVSEMAWGKKIQHPRDVVTVGDSVEVVVLGIKQAERRLSLGLKQAAGDPWQEIAAKFPVGSQIEGPVTKLLAFGAFVQVTEGIEGMIHISEITAERRLNHPSEELRVGQIVQAQVLAIDAEKRQIKLSMKQLEPTGLDEYIAEHKAGDKVSGRILRVSGETVAVELGEGIVAQCRLKQEKATEAPAPAAGSTPAANLSALTSLLQARWKGSAPSPEAKAAPVAAGQVRSFEIVQLDAQTKQIEVKLV